MFLGDGRGHNLDGHLLAGVSGENMALQRVSPGQDDVAIGAGGGPISVPFLHATAALAHFDAR